MNSMVEVLYNWTKTKPDALCIADLEKDYTYNEIWNETLRIASALLEMGYNSGDRIMVECTQDAKFMILAFACELSHLYFVPIEHKAALERVNDIATDSDASVFIHKEDYASDVKKLSIDELFAYSPKNIIEVNKFPEADETSEILYTTGTTGKSKGIEVMNSNNIAIAENIKCGTEMKEGNIELIPLPLSHSHAIRCAFANILNGGAIVLLEGVMRVKLVFELLDKYKATAMDISPAAALVLMRLSKGALANYNEQLDYVQIGTAALPEETKEKLLELLPNVRLYNFYGSTESGRTCVLDFNSPLKLANCIGKPTVNAKFIITDDDRNEIVSSEENPGLIATAGPMNMKGYWKQPELTLKTMHDGFVFTNDLGYINEDGYVFVFGRKDDVINFKGIKIAPEEIEESARKYSELVDCACVPKADKMSGQVPKLFISVKNKDTFDKEAFYKFLEDHIDGNKMPKEIEIIDEIPRTYNGKLQRKKLMETN